MPCCATIVGRQLPDVACGLSCARGRPTSVRTTAAATNVCVRAMPSSGEQSIATGLQSAPNMRILAAAIFVTAVAVPRAASAQADEIQVYAGGLAAPGIFNLTLH